MNWKDTFGTLLVLLIASVYVEVMLFIFLWGIDIIEVHILRIGNSIFLIIISVIIVKLYSIYSKEKVKIKEKKEKIKKSKENFAKYLDTITSTEDIITTQSEIAQEIDAEEFVPQDDEICPFCGTIIRLGARKCPECGIEIKSE